MIHAPIGLQTVIDQASHQDRIHLPKQLRTSQHLDKPVLLTGKGKDGGEGVDQVCYKRSVTDMLRLC